MKNVPIKDLKRNLSYWADEAAHGTPIQVTRYNRPYVLLGPIQPGGVYYGSRVGKESLISKLHQASGGKWLDVLAEDRNDS